MKIICDCHLHSINSFDGQDSVKSLCEEAIKKGINTIAITDHMEAPEISFGAKSQYGDMLRQISKSLSDVMECQQIYKGKIKVLKGMELGEPMHNTKLAKKALAIGKFDFVLASVHNIKNEEDFYFLNYRECNVQELLERYFNELLDTAQNADFDSLAHLTYPLRYIIERTKKIPDLQIYINLIDDIFKTLISREKALEINTSGLFTKIGTTLPDINLIRRFKELGGKYVTIGSDAHTCIDLGKGIEQGIEIAKTCGFNYYTVYENRLPKMIEIWY